MNGASKYELRRIEHYRVLMRRLVRRHERVKKAALAFANANKARRGQRMAFLRTIEGLYLEPEQEVSDD